MSPVWLPAAITTPFIAAVLLLVPAARPWVIRLLPWTAVPALLAALIPVDMDVRIPWMLLGVVLGLDQTGRVFLLFTALLWVIGGMAGRGLSARDPHRARFAGFYLVTGGANLGVVLAQDLASFYFFFALMTFTAYGLILHHRTAATRRAGAVYLVLAVLGEVALLAALLLIAASGSIVLAHVPAAVVASPWRDAIIALLLVGFGVKLGVLGLHVSLPLAYAAIPTPGAVVLAGAAINAGLLGWLRLLPLGTVALPGWGDIFIGLGICAMFYGVVVGLAQRDVKSLLAYSSISQMGFLTVGVGVALAVPLAYRWVLGAVVLYALHHALVKGSLFFAVGLAQSVAPRFRRLVWCGAWLPAAALAGAPLTSGALAKLHIKEAITVVPVPWPPGLSIWIALAAVGTTLLMVRFLLLLRDLLDTGTRRPARGVLPAWLLALASVAGVAWLVQPAIGYTSAQFSINAFWGALWPVLVGGIIALLVQAVAARFALQLWRVPPGDVVVWFEQLWRAAAIRWAGAPALAYPLARPARAVFGAVRNALSWVERGEAQLGRFEVAGILMLLVLAVLFAALALLFNPL